MPVNEYFKLAPDYTVCEFCGKTYADTTENMHRVLITQGDARRIFVACVHCIRRAKSDEKYDVYMTNKTFNDKLGRELKTERVIN